MKNYIILIGLVGMGLSFQACSPGYVGVEPTYIDGPRPARPSERHIWVDGDWNWNRRTHVYARREGNWAVPNQGRTYQSGRWESSPKGHYWTKGRWK
jgi:hypothetical protein